MTASGEHAWLSACSAGELQPGDRREVTLPDGKLILLVRTSEEIFACCADCPHQDTPLIDAPLDGTLLTCPVHFWQWDLRTGEAHGVAELPLPIFETAIRDGEVFVRPRGEDFSARPELT